MKRIIYTLAILILLLLSKRVEAQLGISTGVFIPEVGYTANVYGPLTLRGVGFVLNKYFIVETGFTVYSMPGNAVTHLPFRAKEPLFGASNMILVPLQMGFGARFGQVSLSCTGGGFIFYNFTHRLDKGNWDRAISEYEKWDVANANLSYDNRPGYGYIWGIEIEYHINKKLGVFLQGNYLDGESVLGVTGNYRGGSVGGIIISKNADFNNARLSIKGYEVTIGAHF